MQGGGRGGGHVCNWDAVPTLAGLSCAMVQAGRAWGLHEVAHVSGKAALQHVVATA